MITDISKIIPGMTLPTLPKTDWSKLAWPYLCGLLAENPSKYSATLHNSGFKILSLPFSYHAFPVSDLEVPMNAMKELGIRAYSVTIPYKEDVIPYIDLIGPAAKSIGACNTIINDGNKIHGFNTDWLGVALPLAKIKSDYTKDKALIIGAGGAAKAAVYALKKINIKNITVVNRTQKRANKLGQMFDVEVISTSEFEKSGIDYYNLIINTTPLKHIEFFPYKKIKETHTLFEMLTDQSDLTKLGLKKNATIINGLQMLVAQGLFQFRYFTEKEPPATEMEKKLLDYYHLVNADS